MSNWITLENGNKIDLDQLDTDKGMRLAIEDYYSLQTIKQFKLSKEEYAMVMSNINTFFYHFHLSKLKNNVIAFKAIRNCVYVFKIDKRFNSQVIIDRFLIDNYEEDSEVDF